MTETKTPVLEIKDLGIDFGGLTAVNDLNMTVNTNEIYGLIGPNGAGKTTVFNMGCRRESHLIQERSFDYISFQAERYCIVFCAGTDGRSTEVPGKPSIKYEGPIRNDAILRHFYKDFYTKEWVSVIIGKLY